MTTKPAKPAQDFFLFLIGGTLFAAGIFLFTNQVMINSGFRGLGWGRNYSGGMGAALSGIFPWGPGQGFGLLMIPFGIGVALLFADAWKRAAWFLVWASSAAIGAGVLQSLLFSFRTTSLWNLITMIAMIAGGGGLMFRSLREYQAEEQKTRQAEMDDSRRNLDDIRKELEELKSRLDRS